MAQPIQLFQNYNLTQTLADQGRPISFTQNWLGVLLQISAVTGTDPAAQFRVQWSNEGSAWFDADPLDVIATVTAPGVFILSVPIKACYWRVGAVVTGDSPSFTCSGTAIV